MNKIEDSISRVRGELKAVKEDAFITDRFIYSEILKWAKLFMKRMDDENKLLKLASLFRTIPCIDLIEVDRIEACCVGITSDCIIMRTKEKIPQAMEASFGPILKTISSIDLSEEVYRTEPMKYTNMSKSTSFKFNKSKYYWYIDGYLYFPNIVWEAVRLEILPDEDISFFTCDKELECVPRQQQYSYIPDYLFPDIEKQVIAELTLALKIPADGADDKQSITR